MEDIRVAIAENITELRQNMKLTQSKLADVLNYSDKAVSKWERAEAVPDITVLKQLADYFGVSVDYLLTRDHGGKDIPNSVRAKQKKRNRLLVSALSVMLVWLLTVIIFSVLCLVKANAPWSVFLIALPVSAVVMLVFNSIWGIRRMNFLIITFLLWGLILASHVLSLAYADNNIWPLYLVGIPAQLIIILSSCIKFKEK